MSGWPGLGLLSCLLLVQLALWGGRPPPTLLHGPMRGDPIPSVPVAYLSNHVPKGLRDVIVETGRCTLLAIVDPGCGVCSRMRTTWPPRYRIWADSVGVPIEAIWLSQGNADAFEMFMEGYRSSDVQLAYNVGSPEDLVADLGVVGTPTLYLVDKSGTVRLGVLGDLLPPVSIAREGCGVE